MKKSKESKTVPDRFIKEKKDRKKKKQDPQNKKRLNNRVLKAKAVLEDNREAMRKRALDEAGVAKTPRWKKNLRIVRKVFFWVVIASLAVLLLSFLMIRVMGGTPTVFGYSVQRISSGSMEPTLKVGDIILNKQPSSPDDIRAHDIITFKGGSEYDNKSITHRVVMPPREIDGEYVLKTRGDANTAADASIKYSDVESVFVKKLDFLNRMFDFFLSPAGLLVFIAALIIIYFDEILMIAKVLTGNYTEKDADDEPDEEELVLRQEEEEYRRRKEELRKKRLKNPRKFDNTSNKKKKNRQKKANQTKDKKKAKKSGKSNSANKSKKQKKKRR